MKKTTRAEMTPDHVATDAANTQMPLLADEPGLLAAGTESPASDASPTVTEPPAADEAPVADEKPAVHAADTAEEDASQPPLRAFVTDAFLAQRLRAAREARGWKCADVAAKLRLRLQIVQMIEAGQYEQIGYGIYLRGYLTSYARLVGVPMDMVESVLVTHTTPPPELVPSGSVSRSRYLIDRYSGSTLYLVLTAVIFVPTIMLALNMSGDIGAHLTRLDGPTAPASSTAAADAANARNTNDPAASGPSQGNTPAADKGAANTANTANQDTNTVNTEPPLVASFTPMLLPAQPRQEAPPAPAAKQSLRVTLTEPSWVEIVDGTGKRLEYSTLPAGTAKDYASDQPLEVRLGNLSAVKIEIAGEKQDVTPYAHGNVAHFRLIGKTLSNLKDFQQKSDDRAEDKSEEP
jgi:cytoskeleton protein RodZ